MASGQDPVFGRMKGKIGTLVVYQMYGKTIVRSLPSVKRKPATGALKESQLQFKAVMNTLKMLKDILKPGFEEVAEGRSVFHTALSYNLQRYRATEETTIRVFLQLSAGRRSGATEYRLVELENRKWMLHWQGTEAGKPHSPTDWVMFAAVERNTLKTIQHYYKTRRETGELLVDFGTAEPGEVYDCFFFFRSRQIATRKKPEWVSDSCWCGEVKIV